MALWVQKFGGTSVGSLERIEHCADIIINAHEQGHGVVAVVSAMSGETDRLIALAKQMHTTPSHREYAALLSTGEQVSMTLLTMALHAKGYSARSFTGAQVGIQTDDNHRQARIQHINTDLLNSTLEQREIIVVAGFQGVCRNGDISTLGRGGSDTSAVALSAALNADECQIYTDVKGVYTADPKLVPEARCLARITFDEMLELSSLGTKVLHIRAVEFAGKYHVPLRVLSSFETCPGTLINSEEIIMENPLVSGIAYNRSEAKISLLGLPDKPGIAHQILGPMGDAGIEIDMIIQNSADNDTTDFAFTVSKDDYGNVMELLGSLAAELGARKVVGNNKVAKLSIVGVGMRTHSGIASKLFSTFSKEGINIQMITTSEIKISVIVDEKYLELGVRALHDAFELGKTPVEEFDPKNSVAN